MHGLKGDAVLFADLSDRLAYHHRHRAEYRGEEMMLVPRTDVWKEDLRQGRLMVKELTNNTWGLSGVPSLLVCVAWTLFARKAKASSAASAASADRNIG